MLFYLDSDVLQRLLTIGGQDDYMEYIGMSAFILAVYNMGLSDKVKKLKAEIRKINSLIKGDGEMSKILKELEGKRCTLGVMSQGRVDCEVLSVDDEWMKVNQISKNDQRKIRIIRIENIKEVSIA
jgi:hypothetical protein